MRATRALSWKTSTTCGESDVHGLVRQGVRDGVVMPVDLDVVVEVDPDLFPCGQFVVVDGRGFSSGGPEFEEFPPRLPYSRMTRSFSSASFTAMAALSSSKEKNPCPQGARPSLDVLDRHLGLGLVLGFPARAGITATRNAQPIPDTPD